MSLVVQTSTLECKEALLETCPLFQAHIPCHLITLDFNSAVGVMCDFNVVLSGSDPNSGTQYCVSFSLINLLICHCVSCSCSPFEIHLSINFHLMPQSNHAKHNQSQTMTFQKGRVTQGSGPGP